MSLKCLVRFGYTLYQGQNCIGRNKEELTMISNQAITQLTQKRTEYTDRRKNPSGFFNRYRLNGRRNTSRRDMDQHPVGYYIDRYDSRTILACSIILILCVVDAFITLTLLSHGATEVNLVMRLAIEEGVVVFIVTKYLMTSTSLVFLVIHSRFRIVRYWRVSHVIISFAFAYIALLIYEVVMWHNIS